jgi:hypothetical protein
MRIQAFFLFAFLLIRTPSFSQAQEGQDAETKALDATATQWSFQFAYQFMPDYHQSYPGPAVKNSFRVNATYAIPMSL